MLASQYVFIKLLEFFIDLQSILIVYTNGLDSRPSSFEEPSFQVAKDEDGRGDGHIHIVYGISLLAKSQLFKSGLYLYL
jgi:hypothetical protein